jgi:hypothetical protein
MLKIKGDTMPHRETLGENSYHIIARLDNGCIIVHDSDTGTLELWGESKHFAGYALVADNTEYEFIREVQPCDRPQ